MNRMIWLAGVLAMTTVGGATASRGETRAAGHATHDTKRGTAPISSVREGGRQERTLEKEISSAPARAAEVRMWIWEATNLAAGELEARGDHIEPGDIEKKIGEIWPENAQRVVEHLAGRARNIMNKASARYEVSRALTIAGVQRPHITRLQRMIETTFWEAVREAAHERLQLRQWIWEAFDRIAGADWGNGRGVLTNEIIDRVRTTWPDEADRILEQLALTIGNVIDEAGALTVMQNALEWARHPSTDAATPPLRESAEEDRG